MSNKKTKKVPKKLIDDLQAFLKFYEYGCHMLDSLAEKYLAGQDITPQITALRQLDGVKGIFYLIRTSDKSAESVLSSAFLAEGDRQKLSDIRLKYQPILEDILDVGAAIDMGWVNPISSAKLSPRYDWDEESILLEIIGYSGQRETFRVAQDAFQFLDFAATIVRICSDSLEWCQKQGLPLHKPSLKRLKEVQKELQDSSARLSELVQRIP